MFFVFPRGMAAVFFGRQGKKLRRRRCVRAIEAKPVPRPDQAIRGAMGDGSSIDRRHAGERNLHEFVDRYWVVAPVLLRISAGGEGGVRCALFVFRSGRLECAPR